MTRKRRMLFAGLALLAGALLVGGVTATLDQKDRKLVPLPADPSAAHIEILQALPFQLDEPYTDWWRKEQPEVRSGMILVLRTDPDLIRTRQTAEPVLFVGEETAERCNDGGDSGNLVALVPAPVDAAGQVELDLRTTPIWFGRRDLPERIDAAAISAELSIALAHGVGPAPLSERARTRPALETLYAHDRDELDLTIADLIELYSPTEVDLIDLLRQPKTQ